ncbi:MAG: hypothetical protein NXI00_15660 [Cytophagales bacterium]|nr:hypothetical protein [Cytophagales bacterium]
MAIERRLFLLMIFNADFTILYAKRLSNLMYGMNLYEINSVGKLEMSLIYPFIFYTFVP